MKRCEGLISEVFAVEPSCHERGGKTLNREWPRE